MGRESQAVAYANTGFASYEAETIESGGRRTMWIQLQHILTTHSNEE